MYRSNITALVCVLLVAFAAQNLWAQEAMSMAEKNKMAAKRIPTEIINQGKLELIPEVFSEKGVNHTPPPGIAATGHAAATELFTMLRTAFPDINITVDHAIAEGEYVVQHVTVTGTHKGLFMGNAATNKEAKWSEMHLLRFDGGKVVEHWGVVDMLGMMMQLGLMPPEPMTKK